MYENFNRELRSETCVGLKVKTYPEIDKSSGFNDTYIACAENAFIIFREFLRKNTVSRVYNAFKTTNAFGIISTLSRARFFVRATDKREGER